MTRCKRCGKAILAFSGGTDGCCRNCLAVAEAEIRRRRTGVRDALVALRYSKQPATVRQAREAAIENLRVLARFEREGFGTGNPRPSDLLHKLEATVVPVGPRGDGASATVESQVSERVNSCQAGTRQVGDDFRKASKPGCLDSERRKSARKSLQMYAELEPGGVRAIVQDVSEGGICLNFAGTRTLRQKVRMILHTSAGRVRVEGIVRWVRPDRKPGLGHNRMGLGVQLLRKPAGLDRLLGIGERRASLNAA